MNNITQHKGKWYFQTGTGYREIIATTDTSLRLEIPIEGYSSGKKLVQLPRPSDYFIKKYCEEGGIDEVMVEYSPLCVSKTCPIRDNCGLKSIKCKSNHYIISPKVAPDNTITIREIKDSWTTSEVKELIYKYIRDNNQGCIFTTDDEWINENLYKFIQ